MKPRLTKLTAPILSILIIALLSGCAITRKEILDDDARKTAPGQFIELSKGVVHYEMKGPVERETVVLIHGFATPSFIWDNNYDELVNAGFRVLRYDHYGRGFSDRPELKYNSNLFDQQLTELLTSLNVKLPVHLVGLSMGGAVAINFADRHPEMVSKIALIAPAGFPFKESFAMKLAKLPILGDFLMSVAGDRFILSGVKEAFVNPEKLPAFEKKFKVPMKYRGFNEALLSTMRHMNMKSLGDTYGRVGKQERPVLLIWGRQDDVLPFKNSEKVKEAIPHVLFHAIKGAGHNLIYENPEIVNPILYEFLLPSDK